MNYKKPASANHPGMRHCRSVEVMRLDDILCCIVYAKPDKMKHKNYDLKNVLKNQKKAGKDFRVIKNMYMYWNHIAVKKQTAE